MTSLICLVCRCNLADTRLIKENELFETSEQEAEVLIRGGIARLAAPAEKRSEPSPEPEPIEPPKPHEEVYRKSREKMASDPEPEPSENTGPVKSRRKR